MLSKDVCKKCCDDRIREVCMKCFHNNIVCWEYKDGVMWDSYGAYCPQVLKTVTTDFIPHWCTRKFEHLVAAGMTDEESSV